MSYLVRKITRAKWETPAAMVAGEIPADAVTADLRTRDNKLSFWILDESTKEEIGSIALALAAGSERLDRMGLVWIERDAASQYPIEVAECEGQTPVIALRSRHVDLNSLDLTRLSMVAQLVADSIRLGRFRLFTRKEVRELIEAAVRSRRVAPEDLQPRIREEIRAIPEA